MLTERVSGSGTSMNDALVQCVRVCVHMRIRTYCVDACASVCMRRCTRQSGL